MMNCTATRCSHADLSHFITPPHGDLLDIYQVGYGEEGGGAGENMCLQRWP